MQADSIQLFRILWQTLTRVFGRRVKSLKQTEQRKSFVTLYDAQKEKVDVYHSVIGSQQFGLILFHSHDN